MKQFINAFFLISCMVFTLPVAGQAPCCHSANASFASHAGDPAFAAAHAAPLPVPYAPHGGRMVSIPCDDGTPARAFEVRSHSSKQFLVIIHEWWGLNDHIKMMAERLFHEVPHTNVIAIDLYDGKLATNAEDASKLMQAADEKRLRTIITGMLSYLGEDAVVQTMGWCFGGTWSLQTALMAGERTSGCVMYYGAPEADADKLSKLGAPLLGIWANQDKWITPEKVDAFEKNLKKLELKYTFRRYDADHAFANPSNPQYHQQYTNEAHRAATEFLVNNFAASR